MTSRPRVLQVTLAGGLLGGCAGAPPPSPAHESALCQDEAVADVLATRFDSLRRAYRIPGLAVVILRDTTVVLARGFGLANVERQISGTPETPFNIASVSKPISAVVALRLAEDGVLDLDRPMRRYRGFAEFCDAVRAQGGIFFADYGCEGDRLTLRHAARIHPRLRKMARLAARSRAPWTSRVSTSPSPMADGDSAVD